MADIQVYCQVQLTSKGRATEWKQIHTKACLNTKNFKKQQTNKQTKHCAMVIQNCIPDAFKPSKLLFLAS